MIAAQEGLEQAIDRQCGSCGLRKGCAIEGAARVWWPEHQSFPGEWAETEHGWRCSTYQPPKLAGAGRIDDPTQAEMFPAEMAHG